MRLNFRALRPAFLFVFMFCIGASMCFAQGTVFTYQGRLNQDGSPTSGTFDFEFKLLRAADEKLDGTVVATDVAVTNGLFTVPLDFGPFDGSAYLLEIGVRTNGTTSFTTLSPRQEITSTPYSIRALTASGVAAGSITSASIAPGGLTGAVIQPGSITSNLFAPGAVNAALQSPYQSGRIALDTYTPPANFGHSTINQPVNFPQSFASAPTVSLALETSSRTVASIVPPILVSSKTANGFTATFTLEAAGITVGAQGFLYGFSRFPLFVVNGHPAVVFNGSGLRYVRSQDALGQRWGTAMAVGSGVAFHMDPAVINGNPGLALVRNTGNDVQFVRANDANGTAWPAPITVLTSTPGVFVPHTVSLTTVEGRPAMVCWNSAAKQLVYLRANDSNGSSWPSSGAVIASASSAYFQLTVVSNNPAVAFIWDNGLPDNNVSYQTEVRFLRATDTAGSVWPASAVTITNYGLLNTVFGTQMALVDGIPAVVFSRTSSSANQVVFAKASDAHGSVWGTRTVVYSSSEILQSPTFAIVNGNPAVAYYDTGWNYSQSVNGGVSFSRLRLGDVGFYPATLAQVQGRPALSMYGLNSEVVYLRDETPIVDAYINWLAVQP